MAIFITILLILTLAIDDNTVVGLLLHISCIFNFIQTIFYGTVVIRYKLTNNNNINITNRQVQELENRIKNG